eukprot:2170906-Rhodomonas_salina.3
MPQQEQKQTSAVRSAALPDNRPWNFQSGEEDEQKETVEEIRTKAAQAKKAPDPHAVPDYFKVESLGTKQLGLTDLRHVAKIALLLHPSLVFFLSPDSALFPQLCARSSTSPSSTKRKRRSTTTRQSTPPMSQTTHQVILAFTKSCPGLASFAATVLSAFTT